jgi:hypothetical protein
VSGAPLRYRIRHAKTSRFCALSSDERAQKRAFRSHDAQFFLIDFDALGERTEVIAAVAEPPANGRPVRAAVRVLPHPLVDGSDTAPRCDRRQASYTPAAR